MAAIRHRSQEHDDEPKLSVHSTGTDLVQCCAAFARNEWALAQSKSANKESVSSSLSDFSVALPVTSARATSFAQMCDKFADIDDKDDLWLLDVMQRWWTMVKTNAATLGVPETTKQVHTITADLVRKVFCGENASEVDEVQPVMCSLLAQYFAAVAEHAPWLRCFVERVSRGMPSGTVIRASASTRYFDAAVFASSEQVDNFDNVVRASTLISFEFNRTDTSTTAKVDEAVGQSVQDAANVIKEVRPSHETPLVFAFAGTAVRFDMASFKHNFRTNALDVRRRSFDPVRPKAELCSKNNWIEAFGSPAAAISLLKPIHKLVRYIVHLHDLGAAGRGELVTWSTVASSSILSTSTTAAASSSTVSAASNNSAAVASSSSNVAAAVSSSVAPKWRVPRPLMVGSSFHLPSSIYVAGDVLSRVFKPFGVAPVFPDDSTIKFESVLAATQRRLVCCVRLGESENRYVLKFANSSGSALRERARVASIVNLFAGELSDRSDRVRLPIGYIDSPQAVLVSELWPGRSLAVGCLDDNASREKVRDLLLTQIWPVIDAMRENGFYYIDLHL